MSSLETALRALLAWPGAPEMCLEPDGEFSLDWHEDRRTLTVSICARDGRLSWAGVWPGGIIAHGTCYGVPDAELIAALDRQAKA